MHLLHLLSSAAICSDIAFFIQIPLTAEITTKDASMNRLKMKVFLLLGCLFLSFQTMALGLGELTLKSSLNRPLLAEIQLIESEGLSPWEIKAALASEDVFAEVGVERTFFLSQIKFTVVGDKVRLTTKDAVTEPFLDFLVDLSWPNGRVLREYTLLLDPPAFDESMYQPLAAAPEFEESQTTESVSEVEEQPSPKEQPPVKTADSAASNVSGAAGQYRVQPNDTLWAIALKTRPSAQISAQQMMLAIQDQNPSAFISGNINRLKANQVLDIPSEEAINGRTFRQAVGEVARQNEALGGVAQIDATSSAASRSGSKSYGNAGEVRLVAPERDRSRSAGASGDVGSVGGSGRTRELENDLAMALENLDRSRRENAELNSRLKDLQEQIDSMQRLASLKSDQLANMQASEVSDSTGKTPAKPAQAPAEKASKAMGAQPAKKALDSQPEVAPRPAFNPDRYKQKAPEPTLLDTLLDPMILGAAGLVLLIGLGGFYYWQRKGSKENSESDATAVQAVPAAAESDNADSDLGFGDSDQAVSLDEQPIENGELDQFSFQGFDGSPAEQDGDFNFNGLFDADGEEQRQGESDVTLSDMEAQEISELEGDEVSTYSPEEDQDPLDVADVAIAYGKFDEAKTVLDSAIENDVGRTELRLKRLELLAAQDDRAGFDDEADQLRTYFGQGFDEQIEELQSRLTVSVVDDTSSDDTGFDPDEGLDFTSALDFSDDSKSNSAEPGLASSESPVENEPVVDDLSVEESFEFDLDDNSLDFDLSVDADDIELTDGDVGKSESEAPKEAAPELEQDQDIEFDLDLDLSGEGVTGAEEDKDSVEFDLDLDIPDLDPMDSPDSDTSIVESDQDSGLNLDVAVSEVDVEPSSESLSGKKNSADEMDFSLDDLDAELDDLPVISASDGDSSNDPNEFSLDDLDMDLSELESLDSDEEVPLDENGLVNTASLNESSSEADLDLDAFALDLSEDDIELDADNIDDVFGSMASGSDDANSSSASVPELTEEPEVASDHLDDIGDVPLLDLDEGEEFDLSDLEDFETGDFDSTSEIADDQQEIETSDLQPLEMGDLEDGDDFDFLGGSDECATKLDLARAYVDMGDSDGARDLLDEVIAEGSPEQKKEATDLKDSLS